MSVFNDPVVERALWRIFNLRCSIAAATYLTIHEWMTTFTDEVDLIHPSRWSLVKVGYLFCRYYPLILGPLLGWAYIIDHPLDLCKRMIRPMHGLLTPLAFFPHAILILRAYAFCGRKKLPLVVMLVCYSFQIALDIWVFCIDTRSPPESFNTRIGGDTGCFPDYSNPEVKIRIAHVGGSNTNRLRVIDGGDTSLQRAHRTARRSGLGSFAMMAFINGGAAIAYYQPHREYGRVGLPFNVIVSNLIACRIILQLRHHAFVARGIIELDAECNFGRNNCMDQWVIAEYNDRPLSPITFAANDPQMHNASSDNIPDLPSC
ncbi:hypothetical protein AX16_006588 [Volvariella volvacea WC 439]|nr:hypothetical protein AX16_006588 [Volvariella volvacea WC 439]